MRILLIEDDENLARLLKIALGKEGHEVDYFISGKPGEEKALRDSKRYNLIILDLMLPDTNGFAIQRHLKEKKVTTPVIVLTGRSSEEDKRRAFRLGVDAYMVKPFSYKTLLERINSFAHPQSISL